MNSMHDLERRQVESISLCVQTPRRAKKVPVIGIYYMATIVRAL